MSIITKNMTIGHILSAFPEKGSLLSQAMAEMGLSCATCGAADFETLEEGLLAHGKSLEELERLLAQLNVIASQELSGEGIAFTKRAAEKYLSVLNAKGIPGWGMSLREDKGGCSGFSYLFDYSKEALENDEVFISEGIEIHVNKEAMTRLRGSEIDYIDSLQGAGFRVSNPNVKRSCHCGNSHGY